MRDAEAIVNFAGETHVDRWIGGPFVRRVTDGRDPRSPGGRPRAGLRYVQVSPDEVSGAIETGRSPRPRRSTSSRQRHQTGADLLVAGYFHT